MGDDYLDIDPHDGKPRTSGRPKPYPLETVDQVHDWHNWRSSERTTPMTDLSKAPERIWRFSVEHDERKPDLRLCTNTEKYAAATCDPYIRADLLYAAIEAGVKAGLEAAAKVCSQTANNYDCMSADGKTYLPMKTQKAAKGMVRIAREDILATDPAAIAEAVKATPPDTEGETP